MGRKIPGKKHRTVKDPYKQRQQRLERLKINNPPPKVDEQEIPKSLLEIIKLKNKTKEELRKRLEKKNKKTKGKQTKPLRNPNKSLNKNRKHVPLSVDKFLDKETIPKGACKPEKFIPNLVQRENESAKSFLGRVSAMTENLIKEVEFEEKFGVEIKKNEKTGEVIEVKSVKKKNSKSKKKKLTEKRKEKLKVKKETLKNIKDFSQLKDKVEFGEVVHRPPDLTSLKKRKNLNEKHKYSDLLLNKVVKDSNLNTATPFSNLQKQKAEIERKFIVEAYRKAKNHKRV